MKLTYNNTEKKLEVMTDKKYDWLVVIFMYVCLGLFGIFIYNNFFV